MKRRNKGKWILLAMVAVVAAFGVWQIAHLAWLLTPYNSRYAWALQDLLHNRYVTYEHNNIYTDGVQGLLDDIGAKQDLPDELYIQNAQTIDYTVDGTVTAINMFLYAYTDRGGVDTWLISYSEGDSKILVVTGGSDNPPTDLRDTRLLQPMIELTETMDLATCSARYAAADDATRLELTYWGYRQMQVNDTTYEVSPAAVASPDVGAAATNIQRVDRDHYLTCTGYEVSISEPSSAAHEPARYFASWLTSEDWVDPLVEAEEEHQDVLDDQREDEDQWGTGYLDNTDGTMYCYVSGDIGYRLVVADAAAGSRYYQLEKTTDGGTTWTLQNEDPFLGRIGVVGGMTFTDELHGEIRLDSPSGGTKEICTTADGGVTFVVTP